MNQYRCETCKKTNEYMPFGHDCPFNGYGYTSNQIAQITARCGCASHSDFQSEREKECSSFVPNEFYRNSDGSFCVEKFCRHWKPEKRRCIDLDPAAGSTYEVEEAHCELRAGEP